MFEPNKIKYHYLCNKQPEIVDSIINEYFHNEDKNKDYPYLIINALCFNHVIVLQNDSSTFVTFLKNVLNSTSCYDSIMSNSQESICKMVYYHTAILLSDTKLTKAEKNNFILPCASQQGKKLIKIISKLDDQDRSFFSDLVIKGKDHITIEKDYQ